MNNNNPTNKPNHIEPLLTDCKPSREQDSYFTLVHKINEIIAHINSSKFIPKNRAEEIQVNQSKNTFDAIVDDEPYMPLEDVKKIVELQNHPASPTIKFDTPTAAPQQSNDLPTEECWEASGGGCPATVREEFLRAENTRLKETIQEAAKRLDAVLWFIRQEPIKYPGLLDIKLTESLEILDNALDATKEEKK